MKKLKLNKQTIDDLTKQEMNEVKAGGYKACWENLWTLYYCDYIWTGKIPE